MYKKVKLGNGEVFKFIELNTTGHLKDLRKFGSQDFQTLDDIKLALAALKDRFDKITNGNRIPVFNPNNAGATSLEEIASKQLFN